MSSRRTRATSEARGPAPDYKLMIRVRARGSLDWIHSGRVAAPPRLRARNVRGRVARPHTRTHRHVPITRGGTGSSRRRSSGRATRSRASSAARLGATRGSSGPGAPAPRDLEAPGQTRRAGSVFAFFCPGAFRPRGGAGSSRGRGSAAAGGSEARGSVTARPRAAPVRAVSRATWTETRLFWERVFWASRRRRRPVSFAGASRPAPSSNASALATGVFEGRPSARANRTRRAGALAPASTRSRFRVTEATAGAWRPR